MDYVKLGRTGLEVSRLCLGCMSYGEPDRGAHPWTLDEGESRPFIRRRSSSASTSSTPPTSIPTAAARRSSAARCKDFARRDEVVIATKVHGRMRQGPERRGPVAQGDPRRDRRQPEAARHRLRRPLPDPPLGPRRRRSRRRSRRCNDVVKAGKARYIGASSMYAWQFAKALHVSERHGWARFVYDAEPRQPALPRGGARDAAALPGRGHRRHPVEPAGPRPADPRLGRRRARARRPTSSARRSTPQTADADRKVVEAVAAVAAQRGVPRAQVALAWVLAKPGITAPIVGATKPQHLDDAVAALSLELTADEIKALEAPYVPHAVTGFS